MFRLTEGLNEEGEHLDILNEIPKFKAVRDERSIELFVIDGSLENGTAAVLPHACVPV